MRSCAAVSAIAHYADLSPRAPALIEPGGLTLNYKDFWARVEALGNRLQEAGIDSSQTVAVLLPPGPLQVIAVAGVLNHCACVPLQPKTTVAEVEEVLHKLAASALIVSSEFAAEAETASAMGLVILVARRGQSPEHWQVHAPSVGRNGRTAPSDTILIHVTSATTGSSKIVPLSAANFDAGIAPRRDLLRLTASDRLLQMTSMSHSMGIENTFAQFLAGGAVIATSGFDPAEFPRWLLGLRPTWYDCSPTVHRAALAELQREPPDSPVSLRFIQSAGAPLPDEVRQELERILGVPVWNDYGMTETGCIATNAHVPGGLIPGSAGRPCGLNIGIMDAAGELLPTGEGGEIVVRGPAVFSGYLDDPGATQAAFLNGWFRTGDAGRVDEDRNLFVTGRLKEMINRGGEKVVPAEVDAVMLLHPAVLEAATFSVPHPTLGEDVACAVVLRGSTELPLGIGELRRFAAEKLARFKIPSRIYFVDEIPRGELGKPQRRVLNERFGTKRGTPPSAAELTEHASDEVFYRAYEIWARILDRDDLGFDENFFDAGGDSLAAINMLAEVDQRFGGQTSAMAASFLDEPTLAHLVELVGEVAVPRPGEHATSDIRVFPVRDEDAAQRLFCVPADGDEGLYFRRLAAHLRGQIDLFVIRPANTWFSQSLFTFEHAGAATAKLIRQQQPEGPYLVGGYCSGGVVAVEAARQLTREGHHVRLVLFDVYMPGFPSLLRGWRAWLESARCQWHARGKADNANFALDPRYLGKRLVWSAVIPVRKSLVAVEDASIVKWFLRRAQKGNFPFYAAYPIGAPILHFLSKNQPNVVDRASRLGWREVARDGIEERYIAFDHVNVFHESNLAKIVDTLLRWSSN